MHLVVLNHNHLNRRNHSKLSRTVHAIFGWQINQFWLWEECCFGGLDGRSLMVVQLWPIAKRSFPDLAMDLKGLGGWCTFRFIIWSLLECTHLAKITCNMVVIRLNRVTPIYQIDFVDCILTAFSLFSWFKDAKVQMVSFVCVCVCVEFGQHIQ